MTEDLYQEVWTTFRLVGFHRWPQAPPRRAYLRAKHRHVFIIGVAVETHADRQVEFHDLQDVAKERLGAPMNGEAMDFDEMSCEQIGKKLIERLEKEKDYRGMSLGVSVSEDGESGVRIKRRARR